MGAISSASSLPILKKYLNDANRSVRETCEIALAKIEWDNSEEGQQHHASTPSEPQSAPISTFSAFPSLTFSLQNLHLCRPCTPDFRAPCRQGWGRHGIQRRRAALETARQATAALRALSSDVCAAERWLPRRG